LQRTGNARISGMKYDDLEQWLSGELRMKPFRASQIFKWIHLRGVSSFSDMTDLGKSARTELARKASITVLGESSTRTAEDGTVKAVMLLEDDMLIESVLIPEKSRLTACLSTQVGCRMGCTFCMTGIRGFRRNLRTDEIVAQLYFLRNISPGRISNVVLMGMGEPFDNIEPVADALTIITDDRGICIGSRKITVSTIGLPGSLEQFSKLPGQYGLAISLHSAVGRTREKLIPASRSFPLPELRKALIDFAVAKKRRVTIEYCLIRGVNDSLAEAEALVRFAAGIPCKINLMVYNPVEGLSLAPPREDTVSAFTEFLYPRCPAVTLRKPRGAGIGAACGQLGSSLER